MRRLIALIFMVALCVLAYAQSGKDIDAALIDAVQKYDDGDFDAASLALLKLKKQAPDNDAVLYYLALCNYSQGNRAASEEYLEKAIAIDTTNVWYCNALANIYMSAHDMQKAMPLFERLIRINPGSFSNPSTLSLLGDMKCVSGQDSLARSYYDQALMYDPDYFPAKLGVAGILYAQGKDDEFFTEILSLISDENLTRSAVAGILATVMSTNSPEFVSRNRSRIAEVIDALIARFPDEFQLHYARWQQAVAIDDEEVQLRECKEMVRCTGNDPTARLISLNMLGDLYYRLGERRNAFKAYDAALELSPEYLPVLNNYAYFLSLEKRSLKKALKMSAVTIEKEPENPTYLDTYGWILFMQKDFEGAEKYIKQAIIYGGRESRDVLEHYIEVLDALGKKGTADYYRGIIGK